MPTGSVVDVLQPVIEFSNRVHPVVHAAAFLVRACPAPVVVTILTALSAWVSVWMTEKSLLSIVILRDLGPDMAFLSVFLSVFALVSLIVVLMSCFTLCIPVDSLIGLFFCPIGVAVSVGMVHEVGLHEPGKRKRISRWMAHVVMGLLVAMLAIAMSRLRPFPTTFLDAIEPK
jgi:hypothetical protein